VTAIRKALQAKQNGSGRSRYHSWAVTALVCVVLVAFLAVMQVPHLHATQNDADHCPLCVVMHSTAPAPVAVAAVVLVAVGAPAPQAEPNVVHPERQSRIVIRPPPAGC
jgi:hypothetical protein